MDEDQTEDSQMLKGEFASRKRKKSTIEDSNKNDGAAVQVPDMTPRAGIAGDHKRRAVRKYS